MAFKKVLCALDLGWEPAQSTVCPPVNAAANTVLRIADREARLDGAELVLLHALPMDAGAPMSPLAAQTSVLQRQELASAVIDGLLAAAQQCTGRTSAEVTVLVEDGPAGEAILAAADRLAVDLIVLGHAGAKGLRRLLLGSVATTVVRDARASTMVIRAQAG